MIHLAVHSVEEVVRRELAPRLRGATVATASDFRSDAPAEACEAAAFLGPGQPEADAIERLLRAGKHVLLGTEACLSIDVLEALFDAARATNVRLTVVNPDRYLPSRQLIRQQLDAGKLGEAVLVRLHHWEPVALDDSLDAPRMPDPLLRAIDLALWFLGKSPNLVYAVGQHADARDGLPGRCVQVHLGFPEGGMALIAYANRLPPGDGYRSLSVIGSAGAAYADDHQNMQLVYRGGHPNAVRTDEGAGLAAMVQEFIDAVHAGGETPGGVTAWRRVWAVADAVSRSLETGRAVPPEGS